MNRRLHRIIFNAARGLRMVVQETATSTGKGTCRATGTAVAMGAALLSMASASAQIAGAPNVPGTLRPTVLVAPNGVPLINIQTPSAAGVSRNVYSQFDVGVNGAILNNSRVNTQTQLGGWVQGNPFLATGPARIILNEINSGSPSQLRGYVEVGGSRAEVIIANPAGIHVDGGGFINASKATLTTGTPQFGAMGSLDGFLVKGGTVTIDGAGLDAGQTDYAAILARAVQLNAAIYATDLKVVTGAHQISADHAQVTPMAGTDSAAGTAPTFALDVAALGGMYARKIVLVGTEAGLGVRNAGNIGASAGSLVVTAAGRLENTGTLEGRSIQLASAGDIVNRGTIRQTSAASLAIGAATVSNAAGGWVGSEPVPVLTSGTGAGGGAGGSASTATGSASAGTGSTPGSPSTDSSGSPVAATTSAPPASGFVTAGGAVVNDGGKIYAGGPISLRTQSLINNGGTLSAASVALEQSHFSNSGGLLNVSGAFSANIDHFDNSAGTLHAGNLNIATAGDLLNIGGTLISEGDAILTVGGKLDSTRGSVRAGSNLGIQANSLSNAEGGTLRGTHDVQITSASALINAGSITAGHHTTVTAGNVQSVAGSVLGAGIQADGTLAGSGDLNVIANQGLTAQGTNLAAGNASLRGASVDVGQGTTSASNIALTADSGNVITSNAKVVTPGALGINANSNANQTLVNSAGTLNAGQLEVRVSNISNTHSGQMVQTGTGATSLVTVGAIDNSSGNHPTGGKMIVDNGGTYILVPGVKGNNLVLGVIPIQESPYTIDIGTSELAEFVNATSGSGPGAATGVNVTGRAGSAGGVNGGTRDGAIVEVPSAVGGPLHTGASTVVTVVARTSPPNTAVPNASLFGVNAGPGRYLVATDPRFTNDTNWLSSDYLLSQLGLDPDLILKRLGDGFYEQQLIREQTVQLTGYRYLDDFTNDEDQYTALMTAGATFARKFGLTPGVALTAEQMAQLTSDIVWLVEETVTLPDGRTQRVLAPQVYVRVQPGDITGGGSLLSADAMVIRGSGDLTNRGTIAGRSLVAINADNVNNLDGRITGGSVGIDARRDLANIGGSISAADSVVLTAGRNIRIESTTQSTAGANASRTNVDRIAGVYVSNPNGVLIASAGNDVDVVAGILSSAGSARVGAGHDINLGTVTESASRSMAASGGSGRNRAAGAIIESSSTEVGSAIVAAGDVRLAAGNNLNIRASAVASNDGSLIATARNDINLSAGQSTTSLATGVVSSSRSLVKKSSSTNLDGTSATEVLSTRLSGQSVELSAGNDIDAQAARISAQDAVTLSAARDVKLGTANSTGQAMHLSQSRTSSTGLAQAWAFASDAGGPVGGYGNRQSSANSTSTENTQTAVGTVVSAGSVMLASGRDTRVAGSTLVADGDITAMAGRNLSIESAQSHAQSSSSSASARSGFIGSWSSPGLGHIKTFEAQNGSSTTQERSQVASLGGDVTLVAGNEYRQSASQVMAGRQDGALIGGNVDIRARNVRIEEAYNSEQDNAVQRSGSTQLGGSVSVSFAGAGVTMTDARRGVSTTGALSSIKALSDTDDRRAQALGALSAATMAGQAYDAATSGATSASLNSGVSVSLSRNDSRSVSASNSSTAVGSSVVGTGRVNIGASGGGEDSEILVSGSSVAAGQAARLVADGDITLQASRDSQLAVGNSASHGANVGVTFGVGAQNGLSIQLGVSRGRGSDNQTETRYNVAQVSGADAVDIRSGGDLALRGAVVSGGRVAADVGGNLDITTLQDVSVDRRSQSSSGANLSLCIPPICYGALVTGSASMASARQNGVTVSPNTQSGIRANDGGFDLNVRGNTNLAGGIVESSQAAIDAGRNNLRTGTLTTSDLLNFSEGGARSASASVDYSSAAEFGKYQAVKTLAGNAVANGSANSSAAGVTRAAVSAGSVTIDNEAGQLAATGRTAQASIAALNRNTAQANQPVAAPDMQALQRRAMTEQLIKSVAFDQITVQTDAAYDALFVKPPQYFRVSCGATMTECMQDPSKLVREQIDEATAKREGTVIAVNGIFNSAERAGQLAYQNAAVDEDTKIKPPNITLVHYQEARTTTGELMVATYERFLAPTLGYSNVDNAYADLLLSRGSQPTIAQGHSRGAIVQANAFNIAADAGYTNEQLVASAVGPGTPASIYIPAATRVIGERNAFDNVNYTYLANDPVAVIAAGNPGDVWTAFREFINVIRSSNSAHSCYGTGAQGCATIANPVPGGPVPTHQQPGNIITIRGRSE